MQDRELSRYTHHQSVLEHKTIHSFIAFISVFYSRLFPQHPDSDKRCPAQYRNDFVFASLKLFSFDKIIHHQTTKEQRITASMNPKGFKSARHYDDQMYSAFPDLKNDSIVCSTIVLMNNLIPPPLQPIRLDFEKSSTDQGPRY